MRMMRRRRTERGEKQARMQTVGERNSKRRMGKGLVIRDKERRREASRGGEERKMHAAAGAKGKVVEWVKAGKRLQRWPLPLPLRTVWCQSLFRAKCRTLRRSTQPLTHTGLHTPHPPTMERHSLLLTPLGRIWKYPMKMTVPSPQ